MKKAIPLIVAIVLATFAVIFVEKYLVTQKKDFQKKHKPKTVLVLKRKILNGERISRQYLAKKTFPGDMLPSNVMTPQDQKDVIGRKVNRTIYAKEPLLWSHFGQQDTKKTMSEIIPLDERAITIPMNNISGVDGYIQPNDHVDIYISTSVPTKELKQLPTRDGGVMTTEVEGEKDAIFLLLQNVIIAATGDSFGKGAIPTKQSYSSITVFVTPLEAGLLKFATETGSLSLALRNPKDFSEVSQLDVFDKNTILDQARLKEVQNARKKRIEVYRKGKSKIIER